jgi:hypothetical protein
MEAAASCEDRDLPTREVPARARVDAESPRDDGRIDALAFFALNRATADD